MVRWGYTVDLERCVGCQSCVIACKVENGTPLNIFWMRVLESEEEAGRAFIPVRCNHCSTPPCVTACPTGAFVQRDDGIVFIRNDACIGSMACLTACPYDVPSRWDGDEGYYGEALAPFEKLKRNLFKNPFKQDGKGNVGEGLTAYERLKRQEGRGIKKGTAQKCHFCYHRLDEGRGPACVEACPADALDYGDLDDPESRINLKLRQKNHFAPRQELGTRPGLFYLTGKGGSALGGVRDVPSLSEKR